MNSGFLGGLSQDLRNILQSGRDNLIAKLYDTPLEGNYETLLLHPVVGNWLRENGYTYHHEKKLAEYGRVDFLAVHDATQRHIVVECKFEADRDFGRAAAQVLDYARQTQAAPVIAIPIEASSEHAKDVCDYYGIELLAFDISDAKYIYRYCKHWDENVTVAIKSRPASAQLWMHEFTHASLILMHISFSGLIYFYENEKQLLDVIVNRYQMHLKSFVWECNMRGGDMSNSLLKSAQDDVLQVLGIPLDEIDTVGNGNREKTMHEYAEHLRAVETLTRTPLSHLNPTDLAMYINYLRFRVDGISEILTGGESQ